MKRLLCNQIGPVCAVVTALALSAGAPSANAENRREVTRTALELYHQGDFQRALELYNAAGDALPTIPELEFNKGVTQAQLG
ncbi:MAG TPA: hypothetical protein VLB27_09230, partial [candidate division Zixibacteria bacterium]|nr:hypothetical protein [candidate division Zixibacteria bacterium]